MTQDIPPTRTFITIGVADADTCGAGSCSPTDDERTEDPVTDLDAIPYRRMDGSTETLGDHAGEVVLVVNVASKCGLAPQYEGLQRLQETYGDRGLTVLGFPSNDFMGQEPGTDAEILESCQTRFDVSFPVMSKISVVGDDAHALYRALSAAVPAAPGKAEMRASLVANGIPVTDDPEVLWNFEKFLVGRNGFVLARFAPTTTPDHPAFLATLEDALSR